MRKIWLQYIDMRYSLYKMKESDQMHASIFKTIFYNILHGSIAE